MGLADTGGEPSTQAEGCSFSTNEKKFHRTFDEELIEGTAKLLTHEGYNLAGAVSWFSWVSADRTVRVFSDWRACFRVDSRCVLISIPTRLRSRYLCRASRPRKLAEFGPNVSPSASDPMLPSRSTTGRSAARRPPATSGNVHSLLRPKQAPFWVCWPSEPTKDSIEIKHPEAGEGLEAIGVREQPLTTDHLHHLSPSGLLRVLGGPQSGGLRTPAEKCRPPG
jgi:hypothetical protein